jgi:hypothetical protein
MSWRALVGCRDVVESWALDASARCSAACCSSIRSTERDRERGSQRGEREEERGEREGRGRAEKVGHQTSACGRSASERPGTGSLVERARRRSV